MPNLMPFDELNTFRGMVTEYKTEPLTLFEKEKKREDILDYIDYLLFEAYFYGNVQAMQDLGILDKDPAEIVNQRRAEEVITKPVADKTYTERITEYLDDENSTVEDFMRVAETDSTRIYNTGVVDGGKASGIKGVMKQWHTMEDERVRDAHAVLDMKAVFLDEKFEVDGDSAMAPGGFSDPALNVNCRCEISLIY